MRVPLICAVNLFQGGKLGVLLKSCHLDIGDPISPEDAEALWAQYDKVVLPLSLLVSMNGLLLALSIFQLPCYHFFVIHSCPCQFTNYLFLRACDFVACSSRTKVAL